MLICLSLKCKSNNLPDSLVDMGCHNLFGTILHSIRAIPFEILRRGGIEK